MASSKFAIYIALIADLAIAITKFIAAIITGSSAMMSEGIHSLVDTVNEILLLVGIKSSRKPADANRPFGYGKELYFWSFIVSLLIFSLGGCISFYEGIMHLRHPVPIENVLWSYIVLAIAFVFNTFSFIAAMKAFNKQRREENFWEAVAVSKDPTTFVVLFEDAAGLLGVVVAFIGVYLGHLYNNPFFDGIASIVIGIILIAISVLLVRESKGLLMGEPASEKALNEIIRITESDPSIEKVLRHYSMFMSPEEVVLQLSAVFKDDITAKEITKAIARIEGGIQERFPRVKQIFIEPAEMPVKK
jgi:cation diffusion facilitator family transporter